MRFAGRVVVAPLPISLADPDRLVLPRHPKESVPLSERQNGGPVRVVQVSKFAEKRRVLPLHKMSVISYGEDQPVAPNDDRQGRAKNRRVVVRVLG